MDFPCDPTQDGASAVKQEDRSADAGGRRLRRRKLRDFDKEAIITTS